MATTFSSRLPLSAGFNRRKTGAASGNPIQQGFTLVELLVVVVILGILSGIGIPAILNQQKKAVAASNNSLAMAAARACAAAIAGGDSKDYENSTNKALTTQTCAEAGSTFVANADAAKASAATATITAKGSVDLTTPSAPL